MTCSWCGQEKEDDEFPWRNRQTGTRHRNCKICQREKGRAHYRANHDAYISRNLARSRDVSKEIRTLKESKPCVDCGCYFPYYVMDFDHRPGEKKSFMVSRAVQQRTIATAMREIAKCDLVCSNCHRVRTHKRLIGHVAQLDEHLTSNQAVM